MNNEIKAFLVNIKGNDEWKEIYDYITNLQEENERLKLELSGYRQAILNDDKLMGLQAELDLYKDNNKYLNNKIDKAVKYIGKPNDNYWCEEAKYLLNILKGEDK